MNFPKILLDIAREDWKASEILYKNNLYSQSAFYLQQSVEKTAKSILVKMGLVKPKDLETEIGHRSTKVFEIFKEKNKQIIEEKDKIMKSLPELKGSIFDNYFKDDGSIKKIENSDIDKLCLEVRNNPTKIEHIATKILHIFNSNLELYNDLKNKGIESIIDKNLIEEIIEVAQLIIENHPVEKQYKRIKEQKKLKSYIGLLAENLLIFFPLFSSLLLLIVMTYGDAINSRYPSVDREHNPLDYYTNASPIIIKFDRLLELQNVNIIFLGRWLRSCDKMEEFFEL